LGSPLSASSPSIPSVAAFAAIALAACGGGSLDSLGRAAGSPRPVTPSVSSFQAEGCISVAWPEDPCADEYLLEAASGSSASPAYSTVYRGAATDFRLSGCAAESLFLFRLVEVRGERAFGPSAPALGVGSGTCEDPWEPNDSAEVAAELGYEKAANLYYYRSYGGLEVQDVDWFSVRVPPRMKAYIVVRQLQPLLSARLTTWMRFAVKGQSPIEIVNGQPIAVANYSYSEQTIRFGIFPWPADFLGAGGPQGGCLVDYTVHIERFDDSI